MRFEIYEHTRKTKVAEDALVLIEAIMVLDSYRLDEAITDNIKDMIGSLTNVFKKSGLHVKQGQGLLHYLWKSNKYMAKLFYHAFHASKLSKQESEPHKNRIKEILGHEVKVEEVIDFLLKIDTLTMHLFTGPIHIIDAVAGTHIWANVQGKAKAAIERAKDAIETLETVQSELTDNLKKQSQKYINALRRVFELGEYKKFA